MYIYQHRNWPRFEYSSASLNPILSKIHDLEIKLKALMSVAGLDKITSLEFENLVTEIIKNFEIEAIRLNSDDVRSSLIKKLGLSSKLIATKRQVDGYVEAYIDAVKSKNQKLTHSRLYQWQTSLFLSGKNEYGNEIPTGRYRNEKDGKMTVSSGMLGNEVVHFEAIEGKNVYKEMGNFLNWVRENQHISPILKSAIAHIYFITIHPFNDGNGRICRIISDSIINKGSEVIKYYSISEQIQGHKNKYYDILEKTQKQRSIDITEFLMWYLTLALDALKVSEKRIEKIFIEVKFYDKYRNVLLNERQKIILNAIFKSEYFNKLNTAKYSKYFEISKETASRDLTYLFNHGLLTKMPAGGRETAYYILELGIPDEKIFGKEKQLGFTLD